DPVAADASAAEIIILKISGLFGKTQKISLVVIPIACIKKLRYSALLGNASGIGLRYRNRRVASVCIWIEWAKGECEVAVRADRLAVRINAVHTIAIES